ncbi:uridine kinase [Lactobacillus jensenii]|jgi:uridine kinase|uniref:Uridine kinase n=1 Tax=Lactobacillus jensenii TaxID=109790 RepID=A0A5N1IEN8_LACJE|nr:uridine kinase [Lactobacillus jensenii]EEQ68877.1 uridine kinase [Lactobacillus jensenii 1153]ERJ45001.1 uridine/cytidine kinase [Lactobacillus jensenii MD IIE-70(2)]APT14383.1 uridine kinase [Lactobacillus jensenii]EEQ25067.1 uridine kinase [Lactobacillus jensenii 269-3]EEX28110.1 uridine kinase [Lactobacillus jensenii SJ-7A-US]
MTELKRPIVIGIAGGSGSGKTTIAHEVARLINDDDHIITLTQDSYYKDNTGIPMSERKKINYDHPDAFDMPLLVAQINQLMHRKAVEMPVYDFTEHTRSSKTIHVEPADIIILEGILVLADENLRNLMDIKVYVDTDDDIRFIRRLERDLKERGRSLDSVIDQYLATVKPMYHQFIEPTKRYADIIVPEGGENNVAIDMLTTKMRSVLAND